MVARRRDAVGSCSPRHHTTGRKIMAIRSRWRFASVGVAALAGLGLLGMAAGPASAGGADATAGAGGASAAVIHRPATVTVHHYTAQLVGCCEYAFDVYSNHTAQSSFVPPDGFIGTWTWTKHHKTVSSLRPTVPDAYGRPRRPSRGTPRRRIQGSPSARASRTSGTPRRALQAKRQTSRARARTPAECRGPRHPRQIAGSN